MLVAAGDDVGGERRAADGVGRRHGGAQTADAVRRVDARLDPVVRRRRIAAADAPIRRRPPTLRCSKKIQDKHGAKDQQLTTRAIQTQ